MPSVLREQLIVEQAAHWPGLLESRCRGDRPQPGEGVLLRHGHLRRRLRRLRDAAQEPPLTATSVN
jgi:hypothetical protein